MPTVAPTAPPTAAPGSLGATTGINPWWTYAEESVPGVGRSMVNFGNGNFILQADDVDIHERGIDLAFRRTFNSQSGHDVHNTDGSTPSVYGNRWTSTFDAHLGYNAAQNIISFYDIDGARYDYTSNGSGGWTPPSGQHDTLTFDGGCGYFVTKKDGTAYHMYAPYALCGTVQAAYYGRLTQILGRNNNNAINFTYSWSGNASNPEQLTQILAEHTDGQTLTLNFAQFGGYTELSSIVRPDGSQVTYSYDSSGNLLEVDRPGNNTSSVLPETYSWSGNSSGPILTVYSPRATLASRAGTQDGSSYTVDFDTSNRAIGSYETGLFNPTPNDGTATPIQSGAAWSVIDNRTFSGYGTGTTSLTDSAGHASSYLVDNAWRVTQRSEWTGSLYLVTTETWDASNNLRSESDARGYETDFTYDSVGNTVAVGKPAIATAQGTLRPTQLFTYDAYNNVIAYCDPIATNSLGLNWSTTTPQPGECPSTTVAERYQYAYPTYEPYGELTTATTVGTSYAPSGYATTFTYSASQQGGTDFGLPTGVAGTVISQLDGTARQPQQIFWYDGYGNLACYGKGNGLWILTYDSLNRQTAVADPDDGATGAGICSQSGTSGWNTTTTTAYYLDGSKSQTQTPSQRVAGVATTFTYDADGNELTEVHHFGCTATACTPGTTTKWYDGADRLIEVEQPAGTKEYTRYKYDLSAQGSFSLQNGATSFRAYGGLYASQVLAGTTWYDSKGFAFDGLDRTVTKFLYAPSSSPATDTPTVTTQLAYDTDSAHLGLLSTSTDALGVLTSDTYDADGNLSATSFSDGATPSRSYAYDADERVTSTSSSNGTVSYVYDAAGRQTSVTEAASAASLTISYGYYPDGLRNALSTAGALNATNLFTYAYRTDGKRSYEHFVDGSSSGTFGWSYTNAGRLTSFADPSHTSSKTYDTNGRLATDGMASGTYSAFTYDPEDEVIGYTGAPAINNTGTTPTSLIYYDANGQLEGQSTTPDGGHTLVQSVMEPQLGCSDASAGSVCDVRTGTVVRIKGSVWNNGQTGVGPTTFAFTFDAAGRQTAKELSWTTPASQQCLVVTANTHTDVPCSFSGTHQALRQYDAENHLIAESPHAYPLEATEIITECGLANPYSGVPTGPENSGPSAVSPEYTYWPSGKVETAWFASTNPLFWDGDKPLIANNSNGGNVVYLDDFAIFTNSNTSVTSSAYLTMIDRDFSGTAVSEHNATGSFNWEPLGIYRADGNTCTINRPTWSTSSSGYSTVAPGIVMPRRDGISDRYNIVQGARSYDSDAGQWTAPDAYSGEVDDPATQRAYMWNRNNPYTYNDPAGYDPDNQVYFGVHWDGSRLTFTTADSFDDITKGFPFDEKRAEGGAANGKAVGTVVSIIPAAFLFEEDAAVTTAVGNYSLGWLFGHAGSSAGGFLGGYGFLGDSEPNETLIIFGEYADYIGSTKDVLNAAFDSAVLRGAEVTAVKHDLKRAYSNLIGEPEVQKPF